MNAEQQSMVLKMATDLVASLVRLNDNLSLKRQQDILVCELLAKSLKVNQDLLRVSHDIAEELSLFSMAMENLREMDRETRDVNFRHFCQAYWSALSDSEAEAAGESREEEEPENGGNGTAGALPDGS